MSLALDLLIFATGYSHVLLAPYSKVEESFNLHATHDVLMYGVTPANLQEYDHFAFPGAVPRTFVGSVLLAWATSLVLQLVSWTGMPLSKADMQMVGRLVLCSLNAIGLCLLRRAVSHRFGRPTGFMYTLLTITQFHVPFWMGRTLPNMFALLPAVVFRAEVALLLGPIALYALIQGNTTFVSLFNAGLISGLLSLGLTVGVDSYFWRRTLLWPELNGIYFNVYEGKSSEWGTSPPLTYVTAFLPKLTLGALPLSVLGAILDSRVRSILIPCVIFVGLISCLGHKEWRFIVYIVPLINIGAARGARWMISRKKGTIFGRMMFLAVLAILGANTLVTTLLTKSSMENYPGGEALALFNKRYAGEDHVHVHLSNFAAQTGASLFLQVHSPPYLTYINSSNPSSSHWIYNKTESLGTAELLASPHFTHLIAESEADVGALTASKQWRAVDVIDAFGGWTLGPALRTQVAKLRGKQQAIEGPIDIWDLLPQMKREKQLWILERMSR
ncbi:hypothetical protein HWV62_16508 [Athelia sp. TMB]|nr:hypothetical protein HWV62_16508 [Athelia sp. TMB]